MILSELWIYPIKSCQGLRVNQRQMLRTGLHGDRNWMIVDQEGQFVTQREHPVLATVAVGEDQNGFSIRTPQSELRLLGASEQILPSVIWGSRVQVSVEKNAQASEFFSDLLKKKVSLVTYGKSFERLTSVKDGPDQSPVYFADGYPLLVASETSLAELNSRLSDPVPMIRFRPNLVVKDVPEAFEEDRWERLHVGDL